MRCRLKTNTNRSVQGINSTFKLDLEDDELEAFEVVPRHVIRETEFNLVVKDASKLRFDPHKDPHHTMKVGTLVNQLDRRARADRWIEGRNDATGQQGGQHSEASSGAKYLDPPGAK